MFREIYKWYICRFIPIIGRFCLGDIECYRMLGVYTMAFGSCESAASVFRAEGFEVDVAKHFYGCATSLIGRKPT